MGLNLTFAENEQYLKIANCRDLKTEVGSYSLHCPVGFEVDLDILKLANYVNDDQTYIAFKVKDLTDSEIELVKTLAPIKEDGDDDETAAFITTGDKWTANIVEPDNSKVCEGCPLNANENFSGCYPRMGSYGYVASLHDFLEGSQATDEALAKLVSEPFAIATEPGGYRIGCNEQDRIEKYNEHLESIARIRSVLSNTKGYAANCYMDGVRVPKHGYGASLSRNSIGGYSWFTSAAGDLCWGVHIGKGIAKIKDSALRRNGEVDYFARLVNDKDSCTLHGFDGTETVIPLDHSPIRKPWGNEKEYNELRWEPEPVLPRFAHLLDTAETALRLAIEFDLTVEEC